MRISIIVACDRNGIIGTRGGMPWHLPADLKRFKKLTMGHPMIMGRKTYASIGRPLPGRHSIVVTRDRAFEAPGCTVTHSPESALAAARPAEEVFVIGGGEIYAALLDLAETIHLTRVDTICDGDTSFPELDPADWIESELFVHERDARHAHRFTVTQLRRIRKATTE